MPRGDVRRRAARQRSGPRSEACRLAPKPHNHRIEGDPEGRLRRFGGKSTISRGDAQLEEDIGTIEAPPERERLLCASALEYSAGTIACALACAIYRRYAETRAPKRLHVGRLTPIQGRRVGEWHGQHRSASCDIDASICEDGRRAPIRDRLAGRTPRSERGGRGSTPCPGASKPRAKASAWPNAFARGDEDSPMSENSSASSSMGERLLLQARGCWFESSLADFTWP